MLYDFKAKKKNVGVSNKYMLARTQTMFEYEGLPESLPARELEKTLQSCGYAFVFKHTDGNIYALSGGVGGEPDVYGNPTEIIITNPALKLNKTFKLTDGVLIRNDDYMVGLMPIFQKYNTFLVENELTLHLQGIGSRVQTHITAPDGATIDSARAYLKKLEDGEVDVIADSSFLEGVKTHSAGSSQGRVNELVELHQYIKASMFNEIGLNANYNMKRERLNSAEVDLNSDSILPLVDDMMSCRLRGIEKMNEMFDLEVKVQYGSAWYKLDQERVDGLVELTEEVQPTEEPEPELKEEVKPEQQEEEEDDKSE